MKRFSLILSMKWRIFAPKLILTTKNAHQLFYY